MKIASPLLSLLVACSLSQPADAAGRGFAAPPQRHAGFILVPGHVEPYSFADICQLVNRHAAPTDGSGWSPLCHPAVTLRDGTDGVGAFIDVAHAPGAGADRPAPGANPTPPAATAPPPAGGSRGAGVLVPLAAVPEPADWMLLGGIALMVAMARRRSIWSALNGSTLGTAPMRMPAPQTI